MAVRGTILHGRNVGENDRVLQVFGRDVGLVTVWVRGARASKRRFAGAIDIFATVDFHLQSRREGYSLQAADTVALRHGIRQSLAAIGRAAQLCHLLQALWPPQEPAPQVYDDLQVALDHLSAGRLARASGLYPRLAFAAGLLADLHSCSRCGQTSERLVAPEQVVHGGTLLCQSCAPHDLPLPTAVHAALCGARIADDDDACADAVEALIVRWLSWHSGRSLLHAPLAGGASAGSVPQP